MRESAELEATRREVQALVCTLPAGSPGEPSFDHPWEVRVFALAIAAQRSGSLAWDEFQRHLAARQDNQAGFSYRTWLEALEQVAVRGAPATEARQDAAVPDHVPDVWRSAAPLAIDRARRRLSTWTSRDWRQTAAILAAIVVAHLIAFGSVLAARHAAGHVRIGTAGFGVGLALTAYMFGVRHAFDVDHIAAIDNTTRKLRAEGARPKSVGLWFALGHSTTVLVLAVLVALGVRSFGALVGERSTVHQTLGLVSTLSSGGFLYLIGLLNLASLVGIWRVWRRMRHGEFDEARLEAHLNGRGLVARILRRTTATIARPRQMYAVGLLFGIGFDTATEVSLLVMAGTGVAAGVPWYVVLLLPLLFAAGMTLFDFGDGLLMSLAYDWAFLNPVRKVYYNLTITGLSVAVALIIGSIQLAAVLHDDLGWDAPLITPLSAVPLDHVGFIVVGLFAVTWALAIAGWRLRGLDRRSASAR